MIRYQGSIADTLKDRLRVKTIILELSDNDGFGDDVLFLLPWGFASTENRKSMSKILPSD